MNIDKLLTLTLSSSEQPADELNQKLKMKARKKLELTNKRKPIIRVIVLAAVLTALASATALAAWLFRTPTEVAESLGFTKLAEAFESDDAITVNQSVECGVYRVTLLGITSGHMLEEFNSEIEPGKSYIVTAIQKTDGSAMPEFDSPEYRSFHALAYIKGVIPWQSSVNLSGCRIIMDGIQYMIMVCNTLEPFADRTVYLAVSDRIGFTTDSYNYDMETGEITRNKDYEELNVLFELPLDASKADPGLAAAILSDDIEKVEPPAPEPTSETTADVSAADTGGAALGIDTNRPANIWAELTEEQRRARTVFYATIPLAECELIEDSVKVLELGKDGYYKYKYSDESNGIETGVSPQEFEGTNIVRNGLSGSLYSVWLHVFTKDTDGVVRGMVYNAPLWQPEE